MTDDVVEVNEESVVEQSNPAQAQEKMLSASRVNEIVQSRVNAASDKARRDADARHQAEMEEFRQNYKGSGGMEAPDAESIVEQVRNRLMQEMQEQQETAKRQDMQNEMKQVSDTYYSRMSEGSERYEDFDEAMDGFQAEEYPNLVYLATKLDNTADVLYELQKNPDKLMRIDYWSTRDKKRAEKELSKLSQSIQHNQDAKSSNVRANEPLSRLKPSSSAGADNGQMSTSDYKKMSWMKG